MRAIERLGHINTAPAYSTLVVLPTGGGKTYTASTLRCSWPRSNHPRYGIGLSGNGWTADFLEQIREGERSFLQQDALTLGHELPNAAYMDDCSSLDLFFKSTRLRILYGGSRDYVTLKRRISVVKYGYKRLSPALIESFNPCTYFYHLQPHEGLGGVPSWGSGNWWGGNI